MAEEVAAQTGARETRQASWRYTVSVVMLARLAINIPFRIVYPFLPALSRGLGVPLETASLLLTARALAGAASPIFGTLSDRTGRRQVMLLGLAALVAGASLVAMVPAFGWALVAFVLLGLSKAGYDPAMQAYISDSVPYERRGRVMGLLELAWSGSWLIGIPAAGFLIARYGWQSPFLIIAGMGLISLLATGRLDEPPRASHLEGKPGPLAIFRGGHRLLGRTVLVALIVDGLLVLSLENVFVVYGVWFEERFGLGVTALGLASSVIAGAELLGEVGSAGIVDVVGKRRAVLLGLLATAAAYLFLPRVAGSLAGALAGVCLMFLAFEFTIVSTLPLVSELAPNARGSVMALNIFAMSLGRALASVSGPRLWAAGGLELNAGVSAGLTALAALLLWAGVRQR